MSNIPNVREGENGYNENDLTGEDKAFLAGFDHAVECMKTMEDNFAIYSPDSLVMHYLEKHSRIRREIFRCLEDYMEMDRNETAVSLLDDRYSKDYDM